MRRAKRLNGATIRVQPGASTSLDLADGFRANRTAFEPVVIEKLEEVLNAYLSGRCAAFTTHVSKLVSVREPRAAQPRGRPRLSCPR